MKHAVKHIHFVATDQQPPKGGAWRREAA